MVQPSRPELEVVGVFNPAVTHHNGQVVALLRVAEGQRGSAANEVSATVYDAASGRLEVRRWKRDDKNLDLSDPRVIIAGGRTWLTSISHLRAARSTDGIHFDV